MVSPRIGGLAEISENYDALFCDVWGVLHNGKHPWQGAIEALSTFRRTRGPVIMITNSPKPSRPVIAQMHQIGVPDDGVFDAVVSSGDATRSLIAAVDGQIYFLGPERDHLLFEGLDIEFGTLDTAKAVVCTGLLDDENESPDDYEDLLQEFRNRDLPMICANPDIMVERGDRMIWCAGSLAQKYAAMGGETRLVGKPHTPIYRRAREILDGISGGGIANDRILAIGDGMPTDVKGAMDYGLDLLYVSAGIHAHEYGEPDNPDDERVQAFLAQHGVSPVAYIPRLTW